MKEPERFYLSAGSNLGDRRAQLEDAIRRVDELEGVQILRASAIWETEPQDVTDQPWFYNLVVEGQTMRGPEELLQELQRIERQAGRDRAHSTPRGPRTLDLDILLFGKRIVAQEGLVIPHPRLHQRRFVLEPLLALEPGLIHPQTGVSLAEYLDEVRATQEAYRLSD
jgi:2-amino-4-hydroxy-6-hydroxymethyldihydropteridine diphosphokinase